MAADAPIWSIDWHAMWVPTVGLLELVLRGSAVYLLILVFMRVFRRESGGLSIADLLMVVLVADAAQNGMASEYGSLTEGAVLVTTIFGWNYLLDWLAFHHAWARRLLEPPPLPLVVNGRMNRKHMRQQLLTVDELRALLREEGIDDLADVAQCRLESDGHISVIRRKITEEPGHRRGIAGT